MSPALAFSTSVGAQLFRYYFPRYLGPHYLHFSSGDIGNL
jgi:hypothetical protein